MNYSAVTWPPPPARPDNLVTVRSREAGEAADDSRDK